MSQSKQKKQLIAAIYILEPERDKLDLVIPVPIKTLLYCTVRGIAAGMNTEESVVYDEVKTVKEQAGYYELNKNTSYVGKQTPSIMVEARRGVAKPNKKTSCVAWSMVLAAMTVFLALVSGLGVELFKVKSSVQQITTLQQTMDEVISQLSNLEDSMQQLNSSFSLLFQQTENRLFELNISQNENAYSNNHLSQVLKNNVSVLQDKDRALLSVLESAVGQYSFYHPALSCADLPPSSPSGYYWVRDSNGSAVSVYCDMTRSCGGVTGGWTRVAQLDMTNNDHQCPSGLKQKVYSNYDIRTCVRNVSQGGCSSVQLSRDNVNYTAVCGKIVAYQYGDPEAFAPYHPNQSLVDVDGIILTHGDMRQHIWTFAVSGSDYLYTNELCPCTHGFSTTSGPAPYVGNDYFCESGNQRNATELIFFGDNPLWDGAGCGPKSSECCSFNTPPWFYKQLPQPTTDDIEMRVCRSGASTDEDIAIQKIEILVQ